uniref:Uncharacterized protein n=1 Tax=Ascaris lumbricoides TaxID=6252 RepID=A0A0M3HR71_ASCLU
MSVSVHNCSQASSGQTSAHYSRVGASRQMSNDMVDDEGCCLAKIFLSNIVSFATGIQVSRRAQDAPICVISSRNEAHLLQLLMRCLSSLSCHYHCLSLVVFDVFLSIAIFIYQNFRKYIK